MKNLLSFSSGRLSRFRHAAVSISLLTAMAGNAMAQDQIPMWGGTMRDGQYRLLPVKLTIPNNQPVLRIMGGYDCTLYGRMPALSGATPTARVYPVFSNGGRCDLLIGGRMEIDMVAPPNGDRLIVRTFSANGVKQHEVVLQMINPQSGAPGLNKQNSQPLKAFPTSVNSQITESVTSKPPQTQNIKPQGNASPLKAIPTPVNGQITDAVTSKPPQTQEVKPQGNDGASNKPLKAYPTAINNQTTEAVE